MSAEMVAKIRQAVEARREEVLRFFFDIVAIPSYDAQIRAVGERVAEERATMSKKKRRTSSRRASTA